MMGLDPLNSILDENFLTERNFTNLLLQMAAVATMAIGVVFVLLIGEIDLAVGFVSAVGAVVMSRHYQCCTDQD